MNSLFKSTCFGVAFMALMLPTHTLSTLTSLAKNDPFPVYFSIDPQDFLYKRPCLDFEDPFCIHADKERYSISLSPFGQHASQGANFQGKRFLPAHVCNTPDPCGTTLMGPITGTRIELGDLTGRINMLALLYGDSPRNQQLPISLKKAGICLFGESPNDTDPRAKFNLGEDTDKIMDTPPTCIESNPPAPGQPPQPPCAPVDDPSLIDPTQRYASLTFPLKYSKRGVRFDGSVNIGRGFGINVQTGIAHINQQVYKIRLKQVPGDDEGNDTIENDLTCQAKSLCDFQKPGISPGITNNCQDFENNIKKMLTGNFDQIADQLGIDISDFNATSIEEVRLNIFWRHLFEINKDISDAPKAVCMPFLMFSGSVSPGKRVHPNKLFAVPFGNDGHSSLGFSAGLNIDFVDTIELSGEVGVTHFFGKNVDGLRVPNSIYQKTLFPFTTDALIKPGNNWHFSGKIASYHFLGNLSTYFQYVMVNHNYDTICLKKPDSVFRPKFLEKTTAWKTKLANIGFTYDISPSVALGLLWQAPLAQNNVYRSSTLLFTFNATF